MSFASIFVPNFMVQAVVRSEPSLRDRAMVLVDAASPIRPVIGLNEAASKAGIELGMTKSQTQQFGEIEVRYRTPAQEEIAHAALLDLGWSVSPRIEDTAADNIVLDLAGLTSLFGSERNIARRLSEEATRLGFITQIATASNLDAAILASRAFAGITVIPKGEEAAIIGKAPVNALGWHRHSCLCSHLAGRCQHTGKSACAAGSLPRHAEILETLERWGVRTCAALAALPVLQLSERLGQEGVRLHELARGRSARAIALAQPEIYFEEELELEHAVAEIEPLAFLVGQLLERLCARLAARSFAASALRVRFQLEPPVEIEIRKTKIENRKSEIKVNAESGIRNSEFATRADTEFGAIEDNRHTGPTPNIYERTLRLPVPVSDSKMLLKLLILRWQTEAPSAPVLKILLAAEAARPRVSQGGLFSPLCPDPEKVELTVARLANLVGDSNIGSPELLDTHRPEGFRMRRFVANHESGNARRPIRRSPRGQAGMVGRRAERRSAPGQAPLAPTFENSTEKDFQTAFRVFRPALPAKVEVRKGCPTRIAFSGIRGRVVAASGPWRGSGDWWRENGWESDEWDIEIQLEPRFHSISQCHSEPIRCHPEPFAVILSEAKNLALPAQDKLRKESRSASPLLYLSSPDNTRVEESPRHGVYRVFYDLARKEWFVRGAYD